jgi:hypothetical protein
VLLYIVNKKLTADQFVIYNTITMLTYVHTILTVQYYYLCYYNWKGIQYWERSSVSTRCVLMASSTHDTEMAPDSCCCCP